MIVNSSKRYGVGRGSGGVFVSTGDPWGGSMSYAELRELTQQWVEWPESQEVAPTVVEQWAREAAEEAAEGEGWQPEPLT
jgi:hypothetical protein